MMSILSCEAATVAVQDEAEHSALLLQDDVDWRARLLLEVTLTLTLTLTLAPIWLKHFYRRSRQPLR